MTRMAVALLAALLSGCVSVPRPASPSPQALVCAPVALKSCEFPQYVLPPGDISANQAASIALAERAALCACAARHTALLNCIEAFNGSGRERPAPCDDSASGLQKPGLRERGANEPD